MAIGKTNLRGKLNHVRRTFDAELAKALVAEPHLSHAQIMRRFGVSNTVIRRVAKQFKLRPRKRGPKPKMY